MKHILIPTDFSIKSLNQVKHAVELEPDELLDITLFHILRMPDGIGDLLMMPRRKARYHKQISADFHEACEILKNKYATRIGRLQLNFLFGSTTAVFDNFLEGSHADLVFLPVDYTFTEFSRDSVDPAPLITRCSYPVVRVELGRKSRKEAFAPAVLSDLLSVPQ